MGFRERMKKKKKSLKKRHNAPPKQSGRFPTFFKKDMIPAGMGFFVSKEGEHIIDIIPFKAGPDMPFGEDDSPITEEGELDYILDLEVHMNVGSMKVPFVCPYENFGLPCPICEYMKASGRLEKDEWVALKTKRRAVYLVWVHDSIEEEKKGLQIFHASHFLMEEKLEEIAKIPRGGGYIEFSDYDDGMSIAWTHKGIKRDTRYLGHKLIDRERKIPDKLLDRSFALDQIVHMHPSYNEIEKAFNGVDEEPTHKSNSEKKKKKLKRDKGKKKKLKIKKRKSSRKTNGDDYNDTNNYNDNDIPF